MLIFYDALANLTNVGIDNIKKFGHKGDFRLVTFEMTNQF